MVLHTDEEGVFSGFKARYMFFKSEDVLGGELDNLDHVAKLLKAYGHSIPVIHLIFSEV